MEIKLIRIAYFQVSNALQQKLFLEDKVQLTEVTPLYPTLRATKKKKRYYVKL